MKCVPSMQESDLQFFHTKDPVLFVKLQVLKKCFQIDQVVLTRYSPTRYCKKCYDFFFTLQTRLFNSLIISGVAYSATI